MSAAVLLYFGARKKAYNGEADSTLQELKNYGSEPPVPFLHQDSPGRLVPTIKLLSH